MLAPPMRLGIVIPVINEAESLLENLEAAVEVADLTVVVDGGSVDGSVEIASRLGARVVKSAPGRGTQLNAGAAAALEEGAETLLFLHADTRLPPRARHLIDEAAKGGAAGGGFRVSFDNSSRLFALGARIVNLRTLLLRAPLGDQAQFISAKIFRELGGFRDWPILEDLDLIRRIGRRGEIAILPAHVTTSARRFTKHGIVRTVATNWLIWLLYFLGAPPQRLAKLYENRSRPSD